MSDLIFEERLHLKKIVSLDEFIRLSSSIQVKYDGASCYFYGNPREVTFWSPRISKRTGHRISYTEKLKPFIGAARATKELKGMGELLFTRDGVCLPAPEIGGILNAHKPVPEGLVPELRVYRIEGLRQPDMRLLRGAIFKPCELADLDAPIGEGYVGLDGNGTPRWKYKERDEYDWELVSIDLCDGDKGGIAGTTKWKAVSGEEYFLGPSAGFNRDAVLDMRAHPECYIGRVAKILGFKGHEGRSARFSCWHSDKGVG